MVSLPITTETAFFLSRSMWPDPRKVDWLESESCRKRKARHERQKAQSGADRQDTQGSRSGEIGAGGGSSLPDHGTDLLSLEEGLCRDGGGGYPQAQGDPGGERALEEAGGRSGVEDSASGGCELKKVVSPSARRRAAQYLVKGQQCSIHRACEALHLARSTFYGKASANRRKGRLANRIKALSRRHPTYGYRFITELLRDEGWQVNHRRGQRGRRKEQIQVKRKERKTKRVQGRGGDRGRASPPNEGWSYDFIPY